ncbi:hypothetical protein HZS_6830 [Henneguya salminicola]|nr:hypothetical protein HZS_6830 [Henneguya salminicola]
MRNFQFLIITVIFVFLSNTENNFLCENFKSCSTCIGGSYLCGWCMDQNFNKDRCIFLKTSEKEDCTDLYNPETTIEVFIYYKSNSTYIIK